MSDAADASGAPATDDAALARLLDDAELRRLVDALAAHAYEDCAGYRDVTDMYLDMPTLLERRAALLAYLEAHYVRRDRLYDDGPFDPGDGSAYGDALAREGAPGA